MAQGERQRFRRCRFSRARRRSAPTAPSGPILVAVLKAPALVGELGAFAGLGRTASVRARTPVSVLRIGKAALVEAALAAPAMLIDALARLGDRLRKVNGAIGLYTHALAALERGEFSAGPDAELRNPVPDLVDFGETFARMAERDLAAPAAQR